MKPDEIEVLDELTYEFKHIVIDYPRGMPILLEGKVVGGFLVRLSKVRGGVRVVFFEGIEINPEYRRRGIAKEIIKMLRKQSDLIIGCITEDQPKPFWESVGARMFDLPRESFPEKFRASVHSEEPKMFYITDSYQASKLGDEICQETHKNMNKMK